jgi:hypothetical protein
MVVMFHSAAGRCDEQARIPGSRQRLADGLPLVIAAGRCDEQSRIPRSRQRPAAGLSLALAAR